LDTIEDFKLIQIIFEALYPQNGAFSLDNILTFLKEHTELRKINQLVSHNWLQQIEPGG
jgi:spore coat polysaccharide biosynthesis protein SpsF (cytidylyltransferase family)